jgi:Family of unknown function (DUF6452)
MKYKIFFLLIIAAAFVFACRDDSCSESMVSNVNIHFYKNKTTKDTAIYYLSVYGTGQSDSLIYDSSSMISNISLPIDHNNNQSEFILSFVTFSGTDTIVDSTLVVDSIIPAPEPDTIWKYKYSSHLKNIYENYTETLNIGYKRELELITPECGFTYIFNLDSIGSTKNIIDSIYTRKATIERGSNEENIKIFL